MWLDISYNILLCYYYKLTICCSGEELMGALVNIVPMNVCVPHSGCVIHLQQPRSNMSKPKYLNLSSVSYSVL